MEAVDVCQLGMASLSLPQHETPSITPSASVQDGADSSGRKVFDTSTGIGIVLLIVFLIYLYPAWSLLRSLFSTYRN